MDLSKIKASYDAMEEATRNHRVVLSKVISEAVASGEVIVMPLRSSCTCHKCDTYQTCVDGHSFIAMKTQDALRYAEKTLSLYSSSRELNLMDGEAVVCGDLLYGSGKQTDPDLIYGSGRTAEQAVQDLLESL